MLYLIRILTSLFLIFIYQNARCGMTSGTLAVTANVGGASNCVLGAVRNMIFPNYNPLDANPDFATGSLTVTCAANLPYDVGINQGQGAGATEEHRLVTRVGGKQELNYALFQDGRRLIC